MLLKINNFFQLLDILIKKELFILITKNFSLDQWNQYLGFDKKTFKILIETKINNKMISNVGFIETKCELIIQG